MIKSFRHKGLRRLLEAGSIPGIQASHASRLRMQLTALDTACVIDDMNIADFQLHSLKGSLRGRWSISINGHWRLTFAFMDGNVYVLDYEDYHSNGDAQPPASWRVHHPCLPRAQRHQWS